MDVKSYMNNTQGSSFSTNKTNKITHVERPKLSTLLDSGVGSPKRTHPTSGDPIMIKSQNRFVQSRDGLNNSVTHPGSDRGSSGPKPITSGSSRFRNSILS